MKSENKGYARTLNKRLKGWDKYPFQSNLVDEVREDLEIFYDKYGIETDNNFFATNLDLTSEQEKEYEEIMDRFGDQAGSDVNEMIKSYEEHSDEWLAYYDINSFQDYIEFTDKMKMYESDKALASNISSEQIAELYAKASAQTNLSYEAVDKIIADEIKYNNLTYNTLYEKVLGILNA